MNQQTVSQQPIKFSSIVIGVIGVIGVCSLALPFLYPIQFSGHKNLVLLVTLIVVAAALQTTTVFSEVLSDNGAEVSFAIWLAAAAIFGIGAVPLIAVSASFGFALKRYFGPSEQPKSVFQMFVFNLGTWSLAGISGGLTLELMTPSGASAIQHAIGWFLAAFVNAQVSAFLVLSIVRLRRGDEKLLTLYHKHSWLITQNVILGAVVGGLFALALDQLGLMGVFIFALPIGLTSVSMRVYVRNTQAQMARLEDIVAERTTELRSAYDDLANLNAQKDQFLAVLSHDMKTPLSAIRLYAQLMQRSPDIAAERRLHMLETILQSEKALTDMVMDIVEIERMQLGHRPSLTYQHYDFSRMLNEISATLRPQAEKKSLALTVVPSAAPILMYGDEARLRRVFENLLSNAVKYTPESGRVHVWTTHDEEQIKVFVMDTGYGIPEDDLETIFSPYHRVKDNEQYAIGTGLGLAIVKGFVDMHGGSIDVTSEVGSGSQFEVTLPLHGPPNRRSHLTTDLRRPHDGPPSSDEAAKPHPPYNQPSSPRPRQSV